MDKSKITYKPLVSRKYDLNLGSCVIKKDIKGDNKNDSNYQLKNRSINFDLKSLFEEGE